MDATALSNSLFVSNVTPWGQQFEAKPAGPAKSRQDGFTGQVEVDAPEAEAPAVARQNQTANNEKLEFKKTLGEKSDTQTKVSQDDEQTAKSDKPEVDNTENYVLAMAGAISCEVEALGQQAVTSQTSAGQETLAVSAYLEGSELESNTGNAIESVSSVIEGISGGESENEGAVLPEVMTNQVPVKAEEQAVSEPAMSSAEGHPVQTQQNSQQIVGGDMLEPTGEKTEQQAADGQSTGQAAKLDVGGEAEGVDSQQVKAGEVAVLNGQTIAETKTAQQNDTAAEGTNQQQQAAVPESVVSEVKSSTDKEASKDEAWSFLGQNNGEQAVISTDTAGGAVEKETEVSETSQPSQAEFGKEVFEKVGEQLQASISNSVRQGESEVTVRLNPPELGQVVIKLQQQDGQVTGLLEFSKAETKAEVQQLLPLLVRNLQDAGIAVRKLDVVQTQIDNSGQQQFREHVAGDGQAYQQQFSQGQSDNYSLGYDWISTEPVYAGIESLSESYIGDQAVNILV